ncbi:MAG: DNA topoisomerase IB [Armatimonadota bacterium]
MSIAASKKIKPTVSTPSARRRLADEQPLSIVGEESNDAASPPSPQEAAKAAHLRYVSDRQPGIRREKDKEGAFRYIGVDGEQVTDARKLDRIKALGIPPAYTDVWICPIPHGHLQATGRDAKGRKQYRYHERWRAVRDENKYDRMLAFGDALPRIREAVERDLARPGLNREKVLATIVRLLERTRIRVGNEEYAKQNNSFGLTTLRPDHVDVRGSKLHFHFRGKSGKDHAIDIRDPKVANVVKKLLALDGQELFEYIDSQTGLRHSVTSSDVNEYLKTIGGEEFTAKDFRTWAGTVLCALALTDFEVEGELSESQAKKNMVEAVKRVSQRLGNTPTICRKCYIHPAVLDSYLDGSLTGTLTASSDSTPSADDGPGLSADEASVLSFLREKLTASVDEKKAVTAKAA